MLLMALNNETDSESDPKPLGSDTTDVENLDNQYEDYSSDDSVADKNYLPFSNSSYTDADNDNNSTCDSVSESEDQSGNIHTYLFFGTNNLFLNCP
jgi:hypothetical protein